MLLMVKGNNAFKELNTVFPRTMFIIIVITTTTITVIILDVLAQLRLQGITFVSRWAFLQMNKLINPTRVEKNPLYVSNY